jgi:hypothetical protein
MDKVFIEIDVAGSVKGTTVVDRRPDAIGAIVLSALEECTDDRLTVKVRCTDSFQSDEASQ